MKEITQEQMVDLLTQLVKRAEETEDEGPPAVTMIELYQAQDPEAVWVSHSFRNRVNWLVDRGYMGMRRVTRQTRIGDKTKKPGYYLTDKGRELLDGDSLVQETQD